MVTVWASATLVPQEANRSRGIARLAANLATVGWRGSMMG
jgi:hypothetical protein